jgi:hypothetical protein
VYYFTILTQAHVLTAEHNFHCRTNTLTAVNSLTARVLSGHWLRLCT